MKPEVFLHEFKLGADCSKCGVFVGRIQGNLKLHASWRNAAVSLVVKHERNCRAVRS
jgi:hypothetical protein